MNHIFRSGFLAAVAVAAVGGLCLATGCALRDDATEELAGLYGLVAPSAGVAEGTGGRPAPSPSTADGPGEVVLDRGGGLYGPARFSHKDHARMAGMGRGCALCHHHGDGKTIQSCDTCHTTPLVRRAKASLGWKGAYHQQCLGCHRETGIGCDCQFCHQGKGVPPEGSGRSPRPPVKLPATRVYATPHDGGTTVSFNHESHRECGECGDCHKKDSCEACHRSGRAKAPGPGRKDPHERCASCHGKGQDLEFECADCHAK